MPIHWIAFSLAVALTGCRTQLLDLADAASPAPTADAARPSDAAMTVDAGVDLASSDGKTRPCGDRVCDRATEVCVFLFRGDCSQWTCAPLPPQCASKRDCDCLGASFCPSLAQNGETLTCQSSVPDTSAADAVCASSTPCV